MELNGYRLLLPEGTLDYFDLVDVKESVNEVVIYLEEFLRFSADLQQVAKVEKKKRQPILLVCRLLSE